MTKTLIPNRGFLLGFIPILGWFKGTPEWLVTGMVGHCVYLIMFEGVHLPPDALFQQLAHAVSTRGKEGIGNSMLVPMFHSMVYMV